MKNKFQLNDEDRQILDSTERLLRKLIHEAGLTPSQLIVIGKLLLVLDRLPEGTSGVRASISITSRVHQEGIGGGSTAFHFSVFGKQLEVFTGGSEYTFEVGSDSYTSMEWSAQASRRSEYNGYWDESWLGDGYESTSTIHDLMNCEISTEDDDIENLWEQDGGESAEPE